MHYGVILMLPCDCHFNNRSGLSTNAWRRTERCFTLHVEHVVLGGDLGSPLGHGLAVEDPLILRTGALQDKSPGGVVGHQGAVGWDLHRGDLLVQGHLGQRGGDAAGHHGRLV